MVLVNASARNQRQPGYLKCGVLNPSEVLQGLEGYGNVVFIRHAEKASNDSLPPGGTDRSDVAISSSGMKDCQEWARLLPVRVDLILTSPTLRTIQTSQQIRAIHNRDCTIVEVPFPKFSGSHGRWNQLKLQLGWRELIRRWILNEIPLDGILPCREATQRFLTTVTRTISERKPSNTIVVTHDHVITILSSLFFGVPDPDVGYLCGFAIGYSDILKKIGE